MNWFQPLKASGLVVSLAVLTGCATDAPSQSEAEGDAHLLQAHGLDGLDGREVVEELEELPVDDRPDDLLASVDADAVDLAGTDGGEVSLPLPEDEFYVSVAPYVDQTHDCYLHSLTTCLGELDNEEMDVQVTDADGGDVLVDETLQTEDNGFFGLWLPQDRDVEITVEHDGRSTSVPVSTENGEPTCLTDLRLT